MIDLLPTITQAPAWTDKALAAQFRRCEAWQDAEQWGALGDIYRQLDELNYQREWKYCYRRWNELLAVDPQPMTAGSDRRESE
jgi:hypothetical protein